jgi:hypothetical protein
MPKPTPETLAEFRAAGPIRLRCEECNCERDGIKEVPPGWDDVEEIQSLEDSLTTYEPFAGDPDPPRGYSASDWETHVGICPDCCEDDGEPIAIVGGVDDV